jgi:hypothetical protein
VLVFWAPSVCLSAHHPIAKVHQTQPSTGLTFLRWSDPFRVNSRNNHLRRMPRKSSHSNINLFSWLFIKKKSYSSRQDEGLVTAPKSFVQNGKLASHERCYFFMKFRQNLALGGVPSTGIAIFKALQLRPQTLFTQNRCRTR